MDSLLFTPNTISTDTNMVTYSAPPAAASSYSSRYQPKVIDRWLSQQQLSQSTTQRAPRIMSHSDNNLSSDPHLLADEFTFTMEHHDDPEHDNSLHPLWLPEPPMPQQNMYHQPLHLDTQGISQHHRMNHSRQFSDGWESTSGYNTSRSDPGSSNSFLLSPSQLSTSPNTLAPYSLSPGTPTFTHLSPVGSEQSLSPYHSPSSPGSMSHTMVPSPDIDDMKRILKPENGDSNAPQGKYTAKEQLAFFRDAVHLPLDNAGPFLPQQMYKPHTNSDRKRYVEEVLLEEPLYFVNEQQSKQFGISLKDALQSRTRQLANRDQVVFEGRGPSVSIRIEWPGHRPWSRQIPTKDFRSPPQPITLAKLAKNVAKCVARFMQERKGQPMEEDADPEWRFGDGPNDIKLDDLILVSMHHVSLGSWQPQLRLARPRPPRRRTAPASLAPPPPQGGGGHHRYAPYGPGAGARMVNHLNAAPGFYYGF